MNEIKIKRFKEQRKIVVVTILISVALLLGVSFFVEDKDLKFTLFAVSGALLIAIFIAGAFKGSFGNKQTLEEIEELQFDNRKKEINNKI